MNFAQMVAAAQGGTPQPPQPMSFAQMVQTAQNAPSAPASPSATPKPGGFWEGAKTEFNRDLAGISEAAYPAARWLNRQFPLVDKLGEAIGLPSVNQAETNAQNAVAQDTAREAQMKGTAPWLGKMAGGSLVAAPAFMAAGPGLIPAAIAGAGMGALQPVMPGGNSRMGNAVLGALGGAGGDVLGSSVGRLAHAVIPAVLWPHSAELPTTDLSGAPQTEAVAKAAAAKGQPINPQAIARQAEAERLGTSLTPGQATGDGRMISEERNLRAVTPGMVEHYNSQNAALVNALRGVTDHPSLPNDQESLGDMVRQALKNRLDAHDQAVSDAYKAVQAQNPDGPMMSGPKFADAAQKALHDQMSTDWLSPPLKNLLSQFSATPEEGGRPLNFANFEHLRTRLATEAREGGNAGHAASIVRGVLEDMEPQNLEGKAAADYARSLAKQGFRLREAMPALRSIENTKGGQPEGAAFVRKFLVNAPKGDVGNIRDLLSDNPEDVHAVTASLLAHLRDSGLTRAPDGQNMIKQDAYNKALGQLAPKLEGLMQPGDLEQLHRVGRVANWIDVQPKGSYVNNSNTAVAQVAHSARHGAAAAVDRLFGGMPIGTLAHDALSRAAEGKAAMTRLNALTAPGAGISRAIPYTPTTSRTLGAIALSSLLAGGNRGQ